MALKCTGRRMSPTGYKHEHVAYLWFRRENGDEAFCSRARWSRTLTRTAMNRLGCSIFAKNVFWFVLFLNQQYADDLF